MTHEPLDVEFSPQESGAEFRGDVPTKHAFEQNYDNYYETFVREVLQNANDAGLDNEDPVRVTFSFDVLSGAELETLQNSVNWSKLLKHYEAAVGNNHILRLKQYLDHLDDTDEMVVLTVEDSNTLGLNGDEDARSGRTPYTSLVRDWQVTYKEGSSAGGSHGVGKSVLWASSGISTVLFNSSPSDPSSEHSSPRLIGRSILPDHYINDTHHHGKGWIGREKSSDSVDHPVSIWNGEAEQLASDLGLTRQDESPGTSVLILGFCSPVGGIRPDIHKTVRSFVRAAAKNFWPAIYHKQLEVIVEDNTGESHQVTKDSLSDIPEVAPFIACYEGKSDPVEDVSEPGDVGVTTIPIEFKQREDDVQIKGEGSLCARLKDPGDQVQESTYDLTNHTAIFRGAGMVVDYISKSEPAVYGDDYYGVLIAGEARSWGDVSSIDPDSKTDGPVDAFLTAAEPASHDEWGSTAMLTKKYKRGCVSTAQSLQGEALNRKLVELIQRDRQHNGRFISAVAQHLPEFDQVETDLPGDDDQDVDDDNEISKNLSSDWSWEFEGNQWIFSGWVEPVDEPTDDWGVKFSIPTKGEDNATTGYENVEEVSSQTNHTESEETTIEKGGRSVRIGIVTADEAADGFEFECRSEPLESFNPFSGHGGETTLGLTRADPGGND